MAKVLVVDDSTLVLTIAGQTLSGMGHTVIQLNHGKDLVANLDYWQPHLAVLDYFLPGLTGREIYQQIRAHPLCGGIPVVFLSAKPTHELKPLFTGPGVVRFLTKPLEPTTLGAVVHEALSAAYPAGS